LHPPTHHPPPPPPHLRLNRRPAPPTGHHLAPQRTSNTAYDTQPRN
ncbi:hypothetical protein CesoFtcFv8_000406, partial [Champsocephalus esox]